MIELKKMSREKMPSDWMLREILLSEPDELPASTFVARLPLYLKLLSIKGGR
jgi:hypothetical protein